MLLYTVFIFVSYCFLVNYDCFIEKKAYFCVFLLKIENIMKEKEHSIVISFAILDEDGKSLYPEQANSVQMSMPVVELTELDYMGILLYVTSSLDNLTINEGIGHLFFQIPGTIEGGISNIRNCKGEERYLSFRWFCSETKELQNKHRKNPDEC